MLSVFKAPEQFTEHQKIKLDTAQKKESYNATETCQDLPNAFKVHSFVTFTYTATLNPTDQHIIELTYVFSITYTRCLSHQKM